MQKDNTIERTKNISIFAVLLLALALSSVSDASGVIPEVYISEYGNITNSTSLVNGTFSLEPGLEYRAVRLRIGDSETYQSKVLPNETFSIDYSANLTHRGIEENMKVIRLEHNITKIHNITNLFDGLLAIRMKIPLPNQTECLYEDVKTNFTPMDIGAENQTVYINFSLAKKESGLINVSCITSQDLGIINFPRVSYLLGVNDSFTNVSVLKILPDALVSVTKELKPSEEYDWDNATSYRNWTVDFSFQNNGNISVNITRIHLWATPSKNTTGDPAENKIYEKNFTDCISGDNTIHQGDECTQKGWFNFYHVPVVWSEVFFDNLYHFIRSGNYSLFGGVYEYFFEEFKVELISPPNMSVVDINQTIDLKYAVSNRSNCELYTNLSGTGFASTSIIHTGVHLQDAFEYDMPPSETNFIWNVFCYAEDGAISGFADANFSVLVNAEPRISNGSIPDFTWPEDTNLTLNILDYFYDMENDSFNFTIEPENIMNISYVYSNLTKNITFMPEKDWYGARLARLRVKDNYGRNVSSNLFYLNVTNVADAPEITWWNISNSTWSTTNETNLTFAENQTIRFEAEAKDVDFFGDPSLWFYWFVDGVMGSIGKMFDFTLGWFSAGEYNVTLLVNDSDGLYDTQYWFLNVTNVNRDPYYYHFPDFYIKQNNTLEINLSRYFFDIDLEELNYSFEFPGPENMTVNISNKTKVASLVPETNWNGTDYIRFRATDPFGGHNISNNITLEVYPYIVKMIPDMVFMEDEYNDSLNLSEYYNNHSYERSDLAWETNGSSFVSVMLNILTWQVNLTSQQDWFGNESIMFIARHKTKPYVDNYTINVEVIPVNDPPVIQGASKTIIEDTVPEENIIDLWSHSSDVDDDYTELNYTIESNSDSSLLSCSLISNRYVNCTPPAPGRWGEINLNISVSDQEYEVSDIFNITVFHYDVPPMIINWTARNGTLFYEGQKGDFNLSFYENTWLNWTVTTFDMEDDDLDYFWFYDNVLIGSGSLTDTSLSNQTVNLSRFFDYHSAGDHKLTFKINQTSGDILGLSSVINWDIKIYNNNRPPSGFNLSHPENSTYIPSLPVVFNWTNSTDPDAENHTDYDYWDINYIFQIDASRDFYSVEYQEILKENRLPFSYDGFQDGKYYWRVIATDGDDNTVSERREVSFDFNAPDVFMDIYPNPAEYLYRNVTITWSANDTYLVESYVNITYPNGTLLGNFPASPIKLSPAELTAKGEYEIELFSIDRAGNIGRIVEELYVVNDTEPPFIKLISPKDRHKTSSSTIVFSYEYEDYAPLANCTLYYQKIDQYIDVLGNIIYELAKGPWEPRKFDPVIDTGKNYFVSSAMDESTYRWNIFCFDEAGNSAFAPRNLTFTIEKQPEPKEYVEKLATIESSETVIESKPGYNLVMKVPNIYSTPGRIVEENLTLENTGDLTIRDIDFLFTIDWIDISSSVTELKPGEKIEVPFTVRTPYELGDFFYHVVASSENVNLISPGYISLKGKADKPPVYVIKTVTPFEDHYNISLTIINSFNREIRIYVEDYITGMSEISYDDEDFYVNSIQPPTLITKKEMIEPNTVVTISYLVRDLKLDEVRKPFVITDEDSIIELHIVSSPETRMALFAPFSIEYVLFTIFFVFVLALLYTRYKKSRRQNHRKT